MLLNRFAEAAPLVKAVRRRAWVAASDTRMRGEPSGARASGPGSGPGPGAPGPGLPLEGAWVLHAASMARTPAIEPETRLETMGPLGGAVRSGLCLPVYRMPERTRSNCDCRSGEDDVLPGARVSAGFLPPEAAATPIWGTRAPRIRLNAPRSLNEPVRCRSSSLSTTRNCAASADSRQERPRGRDESYRSE